MTYIAEIQHAFNAHASNYESAAKIQAEIGERLFERLDYLKIVPRYVLDLGCGPGNFTGRLKKYYPNAQVIGVDVAMNMLGVAKKKQSWRHKWNLVNADMSALPFDSGVFDLVFANQVIHWGNLPNVFSELNRVMNSNGCLMFSTLGPDTFRELRQAFTAIDQYAHVNDFIDMHDVGDYLLKEYFLDPVVDMEILTAHYSNVMSMLRSLKAQGVRNIHPQRNRGLTNKALWQKLEQSIQAFKTPEGKLPLTYEVVYGHAWKGEKRRTAQGIETVISLEQLRSSIRKS
jgi:malonyl-CoA O-methyltransferase